MRLHWLVWMPNKNVVNLSIGRFSHLCNTLFWRTTKKRELDVMSVTNYVLTFVLIGNCYQKYILTTSCSYIIHFSDL